MSSPHEITKHSIEVSLGEEGQRVVQLHVDLAYHLSRNCQGTLVYATDGVLLAICETLQFQNSLCNTVGGNHNQLTIPNIVNTGLKG